jgi:hypothetical protein
MPYELPLPSRSSLLAIALSLNFTLAGSLGAEPLPGQVVVSEATPRFLARQGQGPIFL